LVVGAAGVNTAIKRLKDLGFNPIELEENKDKKNPCSGYSLTFPVIHI
jgi:hypothetical protein